MRKSIAVSQPTKDKLRKIKHDLKLHSIEEVLDILIKGFRNGNKIPKISKLVG